MFKKINEIRKNEEGFTIAQVLVSMTIFSTLSAIAIPAAIGMINEDKNMSVQTNSIKAINAINEYAGQNAGHMPSSLGDTKYKNFDDEAKISAVINGRNVCITGWNNAGGDYTLENPYRVLNGKVIEKDELVPAGFNKCDFGTPTRMKAPSVINR